MPSGCTYLPLNLSTGLVSIHLASCGKWPVNRSLGRGSSPGFWAVAGGSLRKRPPFNHRQSGPPERGGNPQNRKQPAKAFVVGPSGRPAPSWRRFTGREKMQRDRAPMGLGTRAGISRRSSLAAVQARLRRTFAVSRFPLERLVLTGPIRPLRYRDGMTFGQIGRAHV